MQIELQQEKMSSIIMPFTVETDNSVLEEPIVKDCNDPIRHISDQHPATRRVVTERLVPLSLNRSITLNDTRFWNHENPSEQECYNHHARRSGRINPRLSQPLPGSRELVRYMLDVPCYLQHTEMGYNDQEKALNFGVINWGRLETWAYSENHEENGSDDFSPSPRDTSSTFSVIGSHMEPISMSCWSVSSPAQNTTPLSVNGTSVPSAQGSPVKKSISISRSSRRSKSVTHRQFSDLVGSDHYENQYKNGERKDMKRSYTPCSIDMPTDTDTFVPNSKEYEHARRQKVKGGRRSIVVGQSHCFEQQNRASSMSFIRDYPRDKFITRIPTKNDTLSILSPGVPRSCSLLPADRSDQSAAARPIKPNGKNVKQNRIVVQSVVSMVNRLNQGEPKANNALGRELSHGRLLSASLSWMKRSSTVTERSKLKQTEQTDYPHNSHGDKVPAPSRGRRSPLRRLLDLLPKPKNNIRLSQLVVASPKNEANEVISADRPSTLEDSVPEKSFSDIAQIKKNPSSYVQAPSCLLDSCKDDRQSTKQALLRLTEKNGAQMIILSSNDNDIFAATIQKKVVSNKDDSEYTYAISSSLEVKKKVGFWRNLGNKKPPVLNVVAQLKVSGHQTICSDLKAHSGGVELVLLGPKQTPETDGSANTKFNNELASIIINIPKEESIDILHDAVKSFVHSDASLSQVEQNPENLSSSSIMVLLPSGVHGMSIAGNPSSLIERWRSGGTCDCGGWDEGCKIGMLYLHDKVHECQNYVDALHSSSYGTNKIELFVQGRSQENKHFFSMISCRQDLYMVEFTESIDLLQAFAICVATLHSKKSGNPAILQDSAEHRTLFEHIFSNNTKIAPAIQHQHLSPVGRA